MKPRRLAIGAAIMIVVTGVLLLRKKSDPARAPKEIVTAAADGMQLTTATDPDVVFKKAFWRRPASDDKIRHAERREWSSSADGVRKWQWFIEVSPGPEMLEWLKTNPFSLATVNSAGGFDTRPDWFPKSSADFQSQRKAGGNFIIMISADQKQLYATDSGLGFGAPDVAP